VGKSIVTGPPGSPAPSAGSSSSSLASSASGPRSVAALRRRPAGPARAGSRLDSPSASADRIPRCFGVTPLPWLAPPFLPRAPTVTSPLAAPSPPRLVDRGSSLPAPRRGSAAEPACEPSGATGRAGPPTAGRPSASGAPSPPPRRAESCSGVSSPFVTPVGAKSAPTYGPPPGRRCPGPSAPHRAGTWSGVPPPVTPVAGESVPTPGPPPGRRCPGPGERSMLPPTPPERRRFRLPADAGSTPPVGDGPTPVPPSGSRSPSARERSAPPRIPPGSRWRPPSSVRAGSVRPSSRSSEARPPWIHRSGHSSPDGTASRSAGRVPSPVRGAPAPPTGRPAGSRRRCLAVARETLPGLPAALAGPCSSPAWPRAPLSKASVGIPPRRRPCRLDFRAPLPALSPPAASVTSAAGRPTPPSSGRGSGRRVAAVPSIPWFRPRRPSESVPEPLASGDGGSTLTIASLLADAVSR
jgi:hypothetical protein